MLYYQQSESILSRIKEINKNKYLTLVSAKEKIKKKIKDCAVKSKI